MKQETLSLRNELALWRKLSRLQDKLLSAYRTGTRPAEATLDGLNRTRKALEPYVQLAVLRDGDGGP